MNLLLQNAGGGSFFDPISILFIGGMLVVFYFFMIRPQQKRAKEQQNFISALEKGSRVVTSAGIHGKIVSIDETTMLIEVDANTKLRFEKSAISYEMTKAVLDPKPSSGK